MTQGSNVFLFSYDAGGNVVSVNFNGTEYYYLRNAQSDIVGIVDVSGSIVVEYEYDAWGKVISTTGGLAHNLGAINPFKYRGYVHDTETGRYYVTSRYYDPSTCRFINADDIALLGANGDFASYNLFAYCGNNPVARADTNGRFWNTVIGAVTGAIVGGISAAITGSDITAGIVSGAISGAVTGAAVDLAMAGGIGLVGVLLISGAGGILSSYVNERMKGTAHDEVNDGAILVDGAWGAVGGFLSLASADMPLKDIFSLRGKELWRQFSDDVITAFEITTTTTLGSFITKDLLNIGTEYHSVNREDTLCKDILAQK